MNLTQLITTIVLSVIGATGGIGGILVAIFKSVWKKQMKARDEYEKLKEEKATTTRRAEVKSIVHEEIEIMKKELLKEHVEFRKELDTIKKDIEIHKKGTQASLRNDLYDLSDKWGKLGYAPREVKENYENLYQNYHNMGKNGVMDDYHNKFMKLPDEPKKSKKKGR